MYQRMFPELKVDVKAELTRYEKYAERIRPYVVESVTYLNTALRKGQKVLVEGANAAMLDIDFGTYCHPAMSVISLHLISEYRIFSNLIRNQFLAVS
jgi:adenylosuccinate synthase